MHHHHHRTRNEAPFAKISNSFQIANCFSSRFFFLILWNTRCEKKEHVTSFNDDDFAYLHKKHHYQRHSLCEKCDHENVTDLHANINLLMPTMFIYCTVWCAFSYWMHSMNFEQQIFCWNVYINANCPNRATISFFYHQRNKKHTNVIANYNAWGMGFEEIDS